MSTDDQVILYSYWRSSCSWRVRLALNLKKIPYKCEPIHLVKGNQFDPTFIQLNPSAQVPVLFIDTIHLSESVAILEYLEETRPQYPLLPSDPKQRAQVRILVEIINAGIQPKQNLAVLNYLANTLRADDHCKKNFAAHWIQNGLTAFESALHTSAGTCCVGDHITFADLLLVPQAFSAKRFGIDIATFPRISAIVQHLEKLPEFVHAHPTAQPDAQP